VLPAADEKEGHLTMILYDMMSLFYNYKKLLFFSFFLLFPLTGHAAVVIIL